MLMIAGIAQGAFGFFVKTRIGNALGLMMAACIALMIWSHHIEATATAKVVTQVTKATSTESQRRTDALEQVQADWKKPLADLLASSQRNEQRLEEIEHASHAHDGQPCLSADAVQRLRAIQ